MKRHSWRVSPSDEDAVARLHELLRIDPLVCRLLLQRGIDTLPAAQLFFRPKLDDLHDPGQMADMPAAIERLDAALRQGERILLYGDYDVDGTTAVALMFSFLAEFYQKLDYYIPDREKEGYGVSLAGVEYARTTGCTLVLALDCGIKAHAAIEHARQYGIDFIVCDHHLPEGELPAAVACLDPKRADCPYPFKELSGCGLAFKLCQALAAHNGLPTSSLESLLDFVAVSIACDIVPVTGENRVLLHYGLQRLNTAPRIGLWALIQRANRSMPLEVSDLVFAVGPMINAAGRVGDARDAVRLLLSVDRSSAIDYAGHLVARNHERRTFDMATADQARRDFLGQPDWEGRRSIVLFDPGWHKGIIGIAASRMAEAFHRPSVIITQSAERAVGSARSVPGFDLYAALQRCEDLFFSYGGHAHAAGMQLPVENVAAFAERFETIAREHLSAAAIDEPTLELDAELELDAITPALGKLLQRFAPFGPGNRMPLFLARGVVDTGDSRLLANNHVRLTLRQADGPGAVFTGIGFGLGPAFAELRAAPFDIAYHLRRETWRGETTLRLQVKAMRASE